MAKKILHVVGARPNFMKIAPVMRAIADRAGSLEQMLVHTGQHYDASMSDVFFEELGIPEPGVNLGVGSGSHAQQTAQVMIRFEPVLQQYAPDWVMVPGDVNSTLACALVASKLGFRVAHLEAGLRSFDRSMPEEINRLLTDQIADLLLTPSSDADENLRREGIADSKIRMVGNVMIDTLVRLRPIAQARTAALRSQHSLEGPYVLATLHRPANVDDPRGLQQILGALNELASTLAVVFPVHPRTRQQITALSFTARPGLRLINPLGYLDFLALEMQAQLVVTDSGGVQEETTFLGVPCLTVRPNTERPVTITMGTNELVNPAQILEAARRKIDPSSAGPARIPPLWDGHASERIASLLDQGLDEGLDEEMG
jgi:UDP-N-acetylglucosamine 2-epimerase (non-hydrolysing)